MRFTTVVAVLSLVLVLAACETTTPGDAGRGTDAGGADDGGSAGTDAGIQTDGGASTDAGPTSFDAGTDTDAGDAGAASDAGGGTDAGRSDAGPLPDSGTDCHAYTLGGSPVPIRIVGSLPAMTGGTIPLGIYDAVDAQVTSTLTGQYVATWVFESATVLHTLDALATGSGTVPTPSSYTGARWRFAAGCWAMNTRIR